MNTRNISGPPPPPAGAEHGAKARTGAPFKPLQALQQKASHVIGKLRHTLQTPPHPAAHAAPPGDLRPAPRRIMEKSGHYVYCIIDSQQERNFRHIGIDRADVMTVSYDDLSMIVSCHPLSRVVVSRENMIAHEKVIERVMQEFDSVLPVRFGTISSSADEIRNLLDRRRREFRDMLRYLDHRVELGVKGLWKDMRVIFGEIVRDNPSIAQAKQAALKLTGAPALLARRDVGMLVEKALLKKKEAEAKAVADYFRKTVVDVKMNKTGGDEMFVNAAFLVDRGREKEFDNLMEQVAKRNEHRALFKYAGPLPAFNFVNIVINPAEWER